MSPETKKSSGQAAIILFLMAIGIFALHMALEPDPETLPDFGEIQAVDARKAEFFSYLAPLVAAENRRILGQRERLIDLIEQIEAGQTLAPLSRHWLDQLAHEYELDWPGESRAETLSALLRRIDTVPLGLALVQAAKESGWGLSRFAREGNNLFGQWCYSPGCGIVPAQRAAGARHEVAAFDSVRQSVRRYVNNLNTHESYRPLRELRHAERLAGRTPTALTLADGLILYSERREAYVEDIKAILVANRDLISEAARSIEGTAIAARDAQT